MEVKQHCVVKKCGLRLSPPTVVVYYETSDKLLHKCLLPIRNLKKNSIVGRLAEEMKRRHENVLETLPVYRIEKMLRILQETLKGVSLDDSVRKVDGEFAVDLERDLNSVDEATLKRQKQLMDETFEVSRKKPGDEDYIYDVQKDFAEDRLEASGWDSDIDLEL